MVPGHEKLRVPADGLPVHGRSRCRGPEQHLRHYPAFTLLPTQGVLELTVFRDGPQRRRPRPRKLPDAAAAPWPVARAPSAAGTLASLVTGARRLTGGPAIERSTGEPGPAGAACGVTPALRIRMRTSAACAAVCTVTTAPSAPLRAVRPDRCT